MSVTMDLDDIKRGLRAEIKKRENEQYATFQCNIRQMCKDVLAKLEELESENKSSIQPLQHHKYKRCLANAWWCRNLSKTYAWSAYNHRGWKIERYYDEKAELYRKWRKRWLELAEKFKEAK